MAFFAISINLKDAYLTWPLTTLTFPCSPAYLPSPSCSLHTSNTNSLWIHEQFNLFSTSGCRTSCSLCLESSDPSCSQICLLLIHWSPDHLSLPQRCPFNQMKGPPPPSHLFPIISQTCFHHSLFFSLQGKLWDIRELLLPPYILSTSSCISNILGNEKHILNE